MSASDPGRGTVDCRALAELFRPMDPEALAREVRRLTEQGLTPRDIAAAWRCEPAQVAAWLE